MKELGTATMAMISAATLLYSVPLLAGVLLAGPIRVRPPPMPELVAQVRFTSLPVVLTADEPEDAPDAETAVEEAASPASKAPVTGDADAERAPPSGEPPAPAAGGPRGGETGSGRAGVPQRRVRKGRVCDVPHPHVRTGADGVVEIDRSLVDEYTANLEAFMRLGYSRPFDEDGVKGWYIAGFSCVSPVYKAGFRRSDVLLAVNGKNTRSWIGVFMLYQKLKKRDQFEVSLVRKGQPFTIQFRVVPG